ncbi:MAG: hypothetical protein AB7D47_04315 [Desulfovibrio sp.]|jgi:hypothetical protein
MMRVDWRSFVPLVQLSTARCPIPVIVDRVRESAREFCQRTRLWTHCSLAADLYAGEAVYGLRPPAETDIGAVLRVSARGRELVPLTPEAWRGRELARADCPECFIVTEPGMVHLWPEPAQDVPEALVVEVALLPAIASRCCPEFLLSRYGRVVAWGAQAQLMLIPDRAWTDPGGAALFERKYEDGIAGARIMVARGGAGARARVHPRPFV